MKSIFIVTGSLGVGGIERVTSRIANYYVDKGYDVTICCLLEGEDKVFVPLDKKIDILFFNGIKDSSYSKFRMAFKWVKFLNQAFQEKKPDYVLAMTLKIGALCVLARKAMLIRVSFRETSDPKSMVRNVFFDRLLCIICRKIDGIIFQTEWEKSCYPKYMQKKGRVIPNPVSVNDVSWKHDCTNKTVVTMGRLNNIQKRHDVLLKAFSLFHKKNPEYKLVVYGDGPDRSEDEGMVKELEIENDVFFVGAKKNVHTLIADADMFVLTSDFEGLSNALAEALLIGIPCISSDWPGCEDIINHNVNGLIYTRQNIDDLVNLMDELANNDKKKMRLSCEAKKLRKRFDVDSVIKDYARIIEGY